MLCYKSGGLGGRPQWRIWSNYWRRWKGLTLSTSWKKFKHWFQQKEHSQVSAKFKFLRTSRRLFTPAHLQQQMSDCATTTVTPSNKSQRMQFQLTTYLNQGNATRSIYRNLFVISRGPVRQNTRDWSEETVIKQGRPTNTRQCSDNNQDRWRQWIPRGVMTTVEPPTPNNY